MNLEFTQHALTRIRQRGLRECDIDVIMEAGTRITPDSVYLRERDVDREVRKRKKEIAALERLRGCRVVTTEDMKVITVYRPCRKTEKRLLRGTHQHKQSINAGNDCPLTPYDGGYSYVR